jgi:diaminopimelate decarboxylase
MAGRPLPGDECLTIREGRLFLEDRDTTELVRTFGSPLFAISETQLRRNVRRFQEAFARQWPDGPVAVLPALKANWSLALRHILSQEGAGCDVYSAGELQCALRSGVEPRLVSVNGGGKSAEHIRNAIAAGVRITVDDVDEIDLIERVAGSLGRKAQVRLRVKPDFPNLWRASEFSYELVPIDVTIQVYKNGIPREHLFPIARRAVASPHIELTGYHLHLGRHHGSLGYWRGAMERYARLIAELKRELGGFEPSEIDIGGGVPTPRDPFAKMVNRFDAPLLGMFWLGARGLAALGERLRYRLMSWMLPAVARKTPNRALVPGLEDYAEAMAGSLRRELLRLGVRTHGVCLQMEPGRSLYGNTGIHLSRVLKVKRQSVPIPWNWVLLDTTTFFLSGGVMEQNLHDFLVAGRADAPAAMTADIVGCSCFADRILPEVRLPEVEPGDVMAILDTGAYQEGSASNFNALPRPATVLVCGSEAELVKRAESIEDVFGRDLVPDRLLAASKVDTEVHA